MHEVSPNVLRHSCFFPKRMVFPTKSNDVDIKYCKPIHLFILYLYSSGRIFRENKSPRNCVTSISANEISKAKAKIHICEILMTFHRQNAKLNMPENIKVCSTMNIYHLSCILSLQEIKRSFVRLGSIITVSKVYGQPSQFPTHFILCAEPGITGLYVPSNL